ncbi:MAG: alpha/beta hydrolase [archaeon]|nr:alpha/beta hydrolase [archaeon]
MSKIPSEVKLIKIDTNSGDLFYYISLGKNQSYKILFIHGLGMDKEWFPEQLSDYSLDEFSWIVPDLIGYGESSKPNDLNAYTMENQAQYLLDILKKENSEDVIIIAHSMGGPIAISLIEKIFNQNKILDQKRLQIKISGLFYLEGNLDKNDAFFSSMIARIKFEKFQRDFNLWLSNLIKNNDEDSREYFENLRKLGPYSLWGSCNDLVQLSVSNELLPRLQQLQKYHDLPEYFVFGENNKEHYSSEILVRNANLPVIFIPKAGHGLFLDNPSDFWRIILNTIRKI